MQSCTLHSSNTLLMTRVSHTSSSQLSIKDFNSEIFQGEVDVHQARSHSHHYFASLRIVSSKSVRLTQLPDEEDYIYAATTESSSVSSKRSQDSSVVSSSTATVSRLSCVSLRIDISCHSVVTAEPWYLAHAEVATVGSPSAFKPIAPDGKVCSHYSQL